MNMLRTKRLILRRAVGSDLAELHAVFSDPRAMRYWTRPAYDDIALTKDMLNTLLVPDGSDEFVIERDGQVIGKCGAWRLPEVGFILHPDHFGQGVMTEAMRALIPHLFAAHPVAALTAEADPRNIACLALLTKLGFVETHRAERTMQWGDEWCDSVYLALARPKRR
jgi:RimJ/RimL family protein N-acetyltransferase